MSAPASMHARRPDTANAGVPANTTRSGAATSGRGGFGFGLSPRLLQPATHHLALQRREVIHEQLADEVIHLVLDADREQAVGLDFERRAIRALRAHADAIGALHV